MEPEPSTKGCRDDGLELGARSPLEYADASFKRAVQDLDFKGENKETIKLSRNDPESIVVRWWKDYHNAGRKTMVSIREHRHEAIPDRAFTHGGIFHADDVFAAALLLMLNPNIEIERGFSVPEDYEGIVFDIGGGEFDHHFEGRRVRDNGVPYAAFGLLWDSFGERLLSHADDRRVFDERFVQPMDLSDNSGAPCEFSETVASFNPTWDSGDTPDDCFAGAVQWAKQALEGRIGALASQRDALEIVLGQMEACDGRVLTLDRYLPWQPAVVGSGYAYVVFPSLRGGYNAQAVPARLRSEELVKPFPEEWRGKDAGELRRITGIPDISFCHLTGFLCAAESLEGALASARLSLSGR